MDQGLGILAKIRSTIGGAGDDCSQNKEREFR